MGTKSIRHICESAVKTYLSAQTDFTGVQINTGDDASLQTLPRIICLAASASPPGDLPEGLGNFDVQFEVHVCSSADDTTLADHRARVAAVAGWMDTLASLQAVFTTEGDASLYDVTPQAETDEHESRIWHTNLSYSLLTVLPA